MKTTLCLMALIGALSVPAAAQQGWQDPLIDRLAGDWVLEGTIGGVEVTHDISAEWVLDHYYLKLHEWSREMTPDGRHEYEAIVLFGWDEVSGEYACLWLDTTGGGGLSVNAQVMGHAVREGDAIPFVFELPDGSVIHNTFTYRQGSDTWQWLIKTQRGDEWSEFARVTLRRNPGQSAAQPGDDPMTNGDGPERVTGIGGLFFRSDDPAATLDWYRTHLGIDAAEWGGTAFQWREKDRPDEIGYTVWSAFPAGTDYFSPSGESFMVNFRVNDLAGLIEALREEGVEIAGDIQEHPNGKFAWVIDPEGRKVELWEPVPSAEDPYL